MLLETLHTPLRFARPVNETSGSYVSKVPTITEPVSFAGTPSGTSAFVHNNGWQGGISQNAVKIFPYGLGADTTSFNMRVIAWNFLPATATKRAEWFPYPLAEVLCAVSSGCPGAGEQILATEFFADTITLVGSVGNPNVSCEIISPGNDTMGHIIVGLKGCSKFEIIFDMVTATSANALLAML